MTSHIQSLHYIYAVIAYNSRQIDQHIPNFLKSKVNTTLTYFRKKINYQPRLFLSNKSPD